MDNLSQSIQKYLGRSLSNDSLNHYTLLGLEPDASTDQIKSALRAASAAWNAADTRSDPKEAQQVAQLLKQAQATLLDANKRALYDHSILAIANKRDDSSLGANTGTLVLPTGDPLSPFDPVAFRPMRSASRFGDPASRWRELEAKVFFGDDPNALLSIAPQPAMSIANNMASESLSAKASTVINVVPNRDNQQNATAIVQQLRRKRQRNQSLMLGGILLAAVAFLGFAAIRFFLNQQNVAANKEIDGNKTRPSDFRPQEEKRKEPTDAKSVPKAPVRSSLPSVNKERESETIDGFDGARPTMSDGIVTNNMATMPPPVPPADPLPPETIKPFSDTSSNTPSTSSTPTMTATMPDPKMVAQWVKAMTEGKAALQKLDFDTFEKSMESALALSMGDSQIAKQKRLDQFGQLYRIAIDAMLEARTKTRGADVVTVGKSRVSIVEVKSDSIVVRFSGENKTYLWSEVPMGIALGLLDLTLSTTEPTDLAARAVYLSFSTAKTDLHSRKIEEFFGKSLGKGDIRSDLPQALTDTYE
ncbi:MAG: J domain-containing protein [Pirellula sp.]|jgi:curved DNA-binding protein CbpA|nr:J domain-containing protein [Pirellula sp.]